MRTLAVGALAAACLAAHSASAAPDEAACAALEALAPAAVRITSAAVAPAGTPWLVGPINAQRRPIAVTAPFCRVQGVIETEIGFELWLPLGQAWNGKFLGAGVGGDAGQFNFTDLPKSVNRGYAAATTDTGHKAADTAWMLGDPARLANYEVRANHLLAVTAKALVATFYGSGPRLSYFTGCSGGGRQGLKELQNFPLDYDGIISGANGPRTPEMTTRRMWEILLRDSQPGLMTPADWRLVSEAGVHACDALDGVVDGVAEDPGRCRFDVAEIQCEAGKTASCLTAEQVAFARKFYAPLRDETGRQIDEGLLPGVLVDSGRSQLALGVFGRAIRHRSDWNGEGFNVQGDLAAIDRVMPELRADRTDLSAFRKRGGKVILYTGWMDPAVAARMVTAYYDALVKTAGGPTAASQFSRLYMLPGVYHCGGGAGPDQIGGRLTGDRIVAPEHDLLSTLEDWVERGQAPGTLVASKLADGAVVRTRPLCPYPQQARYTGKGSTDLAASFVCAKPP